MFVVITCELTRRFPAHFLVPSPGRLSHVTRSRVLNSVTNKVLQVFRLLRTQQEYLKFEKQLVTVQSCPVLIFKKYFGNTYLIGLNKIKIINKDKKYGE